jgi:hypothetical protein
MTRKLILIGAWSCLSLLLWSGCDGGVRDFDDSSSASSTGAGGSSQETEDCKLGSSKIGNCRVH